MSIFWVEHEATPTRCPPPTPAHVCTPPHIPPLSLSLSTSPPPVFLVPSLFFLFLHLFLRESNYVEAEQKGRRQFLSPSPPTGACARALARVFGREKTWSASTAAAIMKGCCCRVSVSVCGILRGLLFLTLFVVKHAQVWGSSSFCIRSLLSPLSLFFGGGGGGLFFPPARLRELLHALTHFYPVFLSFFCLFFYLIFFSCR